MRGRCVWRRDEQLWNFGLEPPCWGHAQGTQVASLLAPLADPVTRSSRSAFQLSAVFSAQLLIMVVLQSQYLFNLLGGTPTEVPSVYHDRSPINHAARITAPLLILQGTEDRVVPPAQSIVMAETIRKAGGKAELFMFEGEGHGFRKLESKKRAYETELAFYRKTFGIAGEE